ncbi:hypothetical protein GCM10009119_38540 [Algoriphagus jejuensis]|uniref:Methyltransferase FkbM domain-containing protein n=1 Tax=Algoriphagus jejuensis TaxID=419934 RepID=A0ABN1N511_9BACT
MFRLIGIKKPSYLDIGAHHPEFLSNTALFYNKGCRGLNIEPNPILFNEFLIKRKKDINLNIGIGPKEEILDFYCMKDSTLSTFSKKEYDLLISSKKELDYLSKIKVVPISDVLEKYFDSKFPDLLSIDVEGLDLEILKTIDFSLFSPKVICVETSGYSPDGRGLKNIEMINFLEDQGYFEYSNTYLNSIFVLKSIWFA